MRMKPFSLRLKTALLAPLPIFALAYFVPTSSGLFPVLIFAPVIVECIAVAYAFIRLVGERFESLENILYTLMAAVPLGVVLLVLVGIYGRVHF